MTPVTKAVQTAAGTGIMKSIRDRLVIIATPRAIALAVGLYLTSVVGLTLSDANVATYAPGVTKPDLRFGYGYADILDALTTFGEGGRLAYAINLLIDTVMPVLFVAATVLVVASAVPRWLGVLSVAPTAFCILDFIENAAFAVLLVQYPDIAPGLVAITSPVTMVKLTSFAVALPTIVLGAAALGFRWLRSRAVTASA